MNNFRVFFLVMTFSMSSIVYSQDPINADHYGSASIFKSYALVLDVSNDLTEYYSADASSLKWTSNAEALKLCGFYSNNLVSLYPDYVNNKILVHIHLDRTKDSKDIIWWNQYLQSIRN